MDDTIPSDRSIDRSIRTLNSLHYTRNKTQRPRSCLWVQLSTESLFQHCHHVTDTTSQPQSVDMCGADRQQRILDRLSLVIDEGESGHKQKYVYPVESRQPRRQLTRWLWKGTGQSCRLIDRSIDRPAYTVGRLEVGSYSKGHQANQPKSRARTSIHSSILP